MARIGKQFRSIGRQTMERLVAYSWPGNVRELENILERAVILAQDGNFEIGPTLLPAATAGVTGNEQLDLATLEYDHIRKVLEQTSGVINGPRGAAGILGLHPNTLRSRMKKLGIARAAHEIS
jgi:formate hydrogenlyase transcriptional activator